MPRVKWNRDMRHSHSQCQIAERDLSRVVGGHDVCGPEHITPEQPKDAWASADACRIQAIPEEF